MVNLRRAIAGTKPKTISNSIREIYNKNNRVREDQ
jgi:hypothetical protein